MKILFGTVCLIFAEMTFPSILMVQGKISGNGEYDGRIVNHKRG
jgi:hypothetical protein